MDFFAFDNSSSDGNSFYSAPSSANRKRRLSKKERLNLSEKFVPIKQRNQANARERDRTHSVNSAFTELRTLIPTEPKDRKLSKIETLRLASSYIAHLGTQLMTGKLDQPCIIINNGEFANRSQMCTFCMQFKKKASSPDENLALFDSNNVEMEPIYYIKNATQIDMYQAPNNDDFLYSF